MALSPSPGKLVSRFLFIALAIFSWTGVSNAQEILSFTPTEDVFVRSVLPTTNYSPATYLRIRSGSQGDQVTFLKFDLSGIGRKSIKKATLRLFVIQGGRSGGTVFPVSSKFGNSEAPWSELSLTYENAPPIIHGGLSTVGQVVLGETVEFDVTSSISVDGKRSFAIVSNANDLVRYSSKEGEQAPELIIEVGPPIPFPAIFSFEPRSGVVGSEITVRGENFLGVSDVQLNGISLGAFSVDSDVGLRFVVPDDATSGKIRVVTEFGEAESENEFVLAFPPTINAFSPTQGPPGTEVTISGTNLLGLADVLFNGASAVDFQADSETHVRAIVPTAATTGPVRVENAAGSDVSVEDFTLTLPPSEIILNPTDDTFVRSAKPANNYAKNADLRVRRPHSDEVYSFLKFRVVGVGSGIKRAILRLTVNDGSEDGGKLFLVSNHYEGTDTPWEEEGLLFDNAPVISGEPLTALGSVKSGERIEIDLTHIVERDGHYSFALRNDVNDVVTYGSNEGPNPPELLIETNIQELILPQIESFTPRTAAVGDEITIRGRNFHEATHVAFNGVSASSFTIDGPTQIRARVPGGASTGKITIVDPDGLGTSEEDLVVVLPPDIASFDPLQGPPGTEVTINGANLVGIAQVSFGGKATQNFQVDSESRLRVRVPVGAASGVLEVSNAAGNATSAGEFVVTELPREISLVPVEDAFVRSSHPDRVYGLSEDLVVRETSNAVFLSYLKFHLDGLGGSIGAAKLRLTVIDASDEGGTVYRASNNFQGSTSAWTEDEVTFNNAPILSSDAIVDIGDVKVGETIEVDVTAQLHDDGFYTFAIKNNSSDAAAYFSKEGVNAPELFIKTIERGEDPDDDGPDGGGNDDEPPADPNAPIVSAFNPQVGAPGMVVTITGNNFTNVTGVKFNETSTISFIADSPTQIRATVPFRTTTGKVSVTNRHGTGTSERIFIIPGPPTISEFSPIEGRAGSVVTITGTNLAGLGSVEFGGGTPATFEVVSDNKVVTTVPATASSGAIIIENAVGRFESAAPFTVLAPKPVVLDVTLVEDSYTRSNIPTRTVGGAGDLRVRQSSSAEYNSYLKFQVKGLEGRPDRATLKLFVTDGSSEGGEVFLVSNNFLGSNTPWNESDLNFENAPDIAGNPIGALGEVTGGEIVAFDATSVINGNGFYTFALSSENTDAAIYSSKEGSIAPELVIEKDGSSSDDDPDDETDPPILTSFNPTKGAAGVEVTLTGSNLHALESVEFGGVATSFEIVSDTRVVATVPPEAASGTIVVANAAGAFESDSPFTVLEAEPKDFKVTLLSDSYVSSNRPTRTVGDAAELRVRRTSSADYNSYLKFEVRGLNESVRSAVLRLFVIDDGSEGGEVFSVSNNYRGVSTSWDEGGLSFENAPEISGAPLSSLGNVFTGEVVEFDVTAAISGDGIFSFALSNETSDLANYSSKEGQQAPELVLRTGELPSKAPVITALSPTAGPVGSEVTISGENFIGSFNANDSRFQGEIRIMPLGNSITQGLHGSTDNAGYRNDLDELLSSQGIAFNFVGSKTDGRDFDRHHEGHSGFRADELLAQLRTYLSQNPPHLILLHIGTNDISENQSVSGTLDEIGEILDTIHDFDSDIVTILSSVVPRRGNKNDETSRLNDLIEQLIPAKKAAGHNLHYAGNNEAFKANPTWETDYLDDSVHPNDLGYAVMAGVWFDAILDHVSPSDGGSSSTLAVAFNGREASRVSVDSRSRIRATVPAGASSGKVSVTTNFGTALSPTNFDVVGTAALALTLPKGGEIWEAGSVHTIAWESAPNIGSINLEYSLNGGASWQAIAAGAANTGRYVWQTPEMLSDDALVRVANAGRAGEASTSERAFALAEMDGNSRLLSLNEVKQAALGQLAEFSGSADVNADGKIDVLDILNTIDFNVDAEDRVPLAKNSTHNIEENARVTVAAAPQAATGRAVRIPLKVETEVAIRGFQMKLRYDRTVMDNVIPSVDPELQMILDYHAEGNSLEILGYLKKENGGVSVNGVLLELRGLLNTDQADAQIEIVEALFISKNLKVIPQNSESEAQSSSGTPSEFQLFQNYPNPFNAGTQIRFNVPSKSRVTLNIFNLRGELVRTLVHGEREAGVHRVSWDGRNDLGVSVATGVYVYRIKAGSFKDSRKLTFVK